MLKLLANCKICFNYGLVLKDKGRSLQPCPECTRGRRCLCDSCECPLCPGETDDRYSEYKQQEIARAKNIAYCPACGYPWEVRNRTYDRLVWMEDYFWAVDAGHIQPGAHWETPMREYGPTLFDLRMYQNGPIIRDLSHRLGPFDEG